MSRIRIELPHHRYDIHIDFGLLSQIGPIVREAAPHARCGLISDQTVREIHGKAVEQSLCQAGFHVTHATIESGETSKSLDQVRHLYDHLLDAHLERRSPIVTLGGGVASDCGGFVAATLLRGLPFIPCPTSLLAMVDASVGGKVGVNVPQGKNLIGAFHQPSAVVIDPATLQSLHPRQWRNGMAECVKHAMICDADLFDWTQQNVEALAELNPQRTEQLIARNVQIKADVVMADERETGVRAHLNFGHTFAHAIEAIRGYGEIQHGEAVALGMVAATALAERIGMCDASVGPALRGLLDRIGLPTQAELGEVEPLMQAMMHDKKVTNNRLKLILPRSIGQVEIRDDIDLEHVEAAWQSLMPS